MNTKDLTRIKTLYELNPEVEEAIDLIYKDVTNRLFAAINSIQNHDYDSDVKSFIEGKRDSYWNIEDLLKKIKY